VPHDQKAAPTSKKAAARQRIAEKRAAEARARAHAQRRRRVITGGIVAAVLVVIALVVVIVVQTQRTTTSADAAVPANTVEGTDGTAFLIGNPEAPTTVDVYEDYLCPACGQFEAETGGTLAAMAENGIVQIRYRPIAILDRLSADDYSTRSLNAAAVVADAAGPEAFRTFSEALFAEQPAENGPGLTDDRLIELAAEAGASGGAVEDGIRNLRFEDWTKDVTDAASRAGISGTPTILVDGEPVQDWSPEGLTAAVQAAQA
jgi:protein-disulfide isomerase